MLKADIMQVVGLSEVDRILEAQRRNQGRVAGTSAAERIDKLRRLEKAMLSRRDEIRAAMWEDFRKPPAEVDLSEIYPVVGEARHAIRHLRRWMRPRRAPGPLTLLGSSSRVHHEPKGVVLIMSPWNFPINLSLGPLVSAVAAGNCIVLKPSEMTPRSSACMKRILTDLFDESEVAVVEGDARVAEDLLRRRFDHIFFTGSPAVGRLVMKAAAEHLTSVTLELGGKSPVIVDRTADLDEAATKIAWGKLLNSGQTCIAPDYVLVDESVRDAFLLKLRRAVESFGGAESRSAMINDRHAARVARLIDSAVSAGAEVVIGGEVTVLAGVPPDSAVMQEEIFGPVLPVVSYRTLDEALDLIASKEKPLVLYIFSRARRVVRQILSGTTAGGTVINHTLIHFYQLNVPFGGVGNSGMGRGHGFAGFEAFSNIRGVVEQRTRLSPINLIYPPYTGFKQKVIDLMLRFL